MVSPLRAPGDQASSASRFAKLALGSDSDWLGRRDSNPRMPAPEAGALPLGYSPMNLCE